MVQIFSISVMMHKDAETIPLSFLAEYDLSSFSFFKRGTVKEIVAFFMRQCIQRTEPGERNAVDQGEYRCHTWVAGDNLACAVVTDTDYPERVAFSLASVCLREFKNAHGDAWMECEEDKIMSTPAIIELISRYQTPDEADNISKITKELEEVKDILHNTMEDLLKRGEHLETIIDRSDDLSASSKQFLWQAQKQNSCCGTTYI